ncbi:hypothetical protein A1Q2_02561 [Trichosporon asahii var. asahii CBS 8904]|uniref:Uncharacterized protein n=1 Tax=Trichosporon asahii var. asahii (strain CBS 8904) TaxID=1220162 RepID=K1VUC6_TRIAC|nr:hypothetical protein A1Q2_02561 [Trichosporon asahii var. asahii CBS 8904]
MKFYAIVTALFAAIGLASAAPWGEDNEEVPRRNLNAIVPIPSLLWCTLQERVALSQAAWTEQKTDLL